MSHPDPLELAIIKAISPNSASIEAQQITDTPISKGHQRMFWLSLHGWETAMLISLGAAAFAAFAVVASTWFVILLQRESLKVSEAEFEKYKVDAGVQIAKAAKDAEQAKAETAKANERAEAARAEAAKANERILEMQRIRRLKKAQAEALRPLLTSESFQKEPKPALRVEAVADAEAQMFATEIQSFFLSCDVNVFPTNRGHVNDCTQLVPNQNGLVLTVKSLHELNSPFAIFQHLMCSIGLKLDAEENPALRENEAMLSVLRKPTIEE